MTNSAIRTPMSVARRKLLAIAALFCYAGHFAAHVRIGTPEEMLWACHVAALLIAAGIFAGSSELGFTGVLWLSYGTPLWIYGLVAGEEFMPTSILTHVVAFGIGIYFVFRAGVRRGTFLRAALGLIPLFVVTRLLTPEKLNVNLAFRIFPGSEPYFYSFEVYVLTLLLGAALTFFVIETLVLKFANPAECASE